MQYFINRRAISWIERRCRSVSHIELDFFVIYFYFYDVVFARTLGILLDLQYFDHKFNSIDFAVVIEPNDAME
jgi:hypothetical protein